MLSKDAQDQMEMSNTEYKATQDWLRVLGTISVSPAIDLDSFLRRANKAMSVGSLIDPTLFLAGGESLTRGLQLAIAARDFRAAVTRIFPTVETGEKPNAE